MYREIIVLNVLFFVMGSALATETNMQKKQIVFTQSDSDKMVQFEKEIAYFYGAKNPELIAKHYLKAIEKLEQIGIQVDNNLLEKSMLHHLKEAYQEVRNQTHLKFDIDKAAKYEFQLILAQTKEEPFEKIYHIMVNLYKEIFHSDKLDIHKGAMLRTFLYKYKLSLLKKNNTLSDSDQDLMLAIAKASKKALNNSER